MFVVIEIEFHNLVSALNTDKETEILTHLDIDAVDQNLSLRPSLCSGRENSCRTKHYS